MNRSPEAGEAVPHLAESGDGAPDPICVLYVPSLDRRRVSAESTPFVQSLIDRYGSIRIHPLPTTELVPTLVTGVLPHEHRIWQVSLRPDAWSRTGDAPAFLPDAVRRKLQLFRHLFDSTFELPVIPPSRREKFRMHRFKYRRRQEDPGVMQSIGGQTTVFGLLGSRARYSFGAEFSAAADLAERIPSEGLRLDFLEYYALDLFSHWHLDKPDEVLRALRVTDSAARQLHDRCVEAGFRFILLVDHGQEPVRGSIDIQAALRESGLSRDDYTYLVEVGAARFWARTDETRERLEKVLRGVSHTHVLTWREMHEYDIRFPDSSFGEIYAYPETGYIFFPHDFYDPLANLFLGLRHPTQRPRIRNPRHRGNHGSLPGHPAEEGYMIVADEGVEPLRDSMQLVDFLPTILTLLDEAVPGSLPGSPAYGPGTHP